MTTLRLWRLFHRPGRRDAAGRTATLATVAFAAAAAIFLTVLGGVHAFIRRASPDRTLGCLLDKRACAPGALEAWSHRLADPHDPAQYAATYVLFAAFACVLLVVPFVALAGSAARLAASRRDQRLAALRLAGATRAQVTALTALDAAGQALTGALIGIVGYVVLMPAIMLLNFQNEPFTAAQLWVGVPALLATVAGVTVLALVSALAALRRVAITPLGVAARQTRPLPARWRALVFVTVLGVAVFALANMQLFAGLSDAMVYVVLFAMFALPFALVNLVGAWVVAARARAKARRPKDAATMLAMRRILDDPKRAWRNVSGIALAVFVAGITSATGGIAAMAAPEGTAADDPMLVFTRDIGTGGLLTLAFAGVLAAVSCGVMQAGSVIEQADEYRMLMLEGTDARTLDRARFVEVLTPLATVVVVAGACSLLLMWPLFAQLMTQPGSIVMFVGGVAACFALVMVGALAANRVAAGISVTGLRRDD